MKQFIVLQGHPDEDHEPYYASIYDAETASDAAVQWLRDVFGEEEKGIDEFFGTEDEDEITVCEVVVRTVRLIRKVDVIGELVDVDASRK